jgi:hypothetical protein
MKKKRENANVAQSFLTEKPCSHSWLRYGAFALISG